jgi:metal-responsive CopG/Arc/MetJ family transcriptional regulator
MLALLAVMERVMIQADRALLERARRAARERGVSFPQLVRDALEHELATRADPPRRLACVGVISTGGHARERAYEPDVWR